MHHKPKPPQPPAVEDLLGLAQIQEVIDESAIERFWHSTSPRVRFFKTLPKNAVLLDLGAGDGSLSVFREWIEPLRPDIQMYAVSLDKGNKFNKYQGYELRDFNVDKPDFNGLKFDAVFCSHFVEHIIDGPSVLAKWAKSRLCQFGRIYVECPTIFSKNSPSRTRFLEHGIEVSTTNFFDDRTHVDTPSLEELKVCFEENGFFVDESGYYRNPFVENEMLSIGIRKKKPFNSTMAVWMKWYFAQYVMASSL